MRAPGSVITTEVCCWCREPASAPFMSLRRDAHHVGPCPGLVPHQQTEAGSWAESAHDTDFQIFASALPLYLEPMACCPRSAGDAATLLCGLWCRGGLEKSAFPSIAAKLWEAPQDPSGLPRTCDD